MSKITRIIALLASIAVAGSMMVACGNKDGESKTEGTSDKAAKLKWIQIGAQPKDLDMVSKEMNAYIKDKVNAEVEFTYLDWGVWGDKVTAIINSGEAFDIMFTNGDKYNAGVSMNAFADLTDMIKKTPKLTELIPESVWKGVTIKEKIWAIPTYKDSAQTQYWVWDKALTEKYNIDYKNIKTLKDMDPALRTIQAGIDAGEVTQGKYAFNNGKDGVNGMYMNYDSQGGVPAIGVRYDDATAKVINVLEQPEIMENFEYLHQWYTDGIINPDASTQTEGPKWIPVGSAQGFPGAEHGWGAGRGADVVIQPWGGPIFSTGTILGSVNAISAASKNKETALKYLELVNSDTKLRTMLAYGIEGTHYVDDGDGTITRDTVKKDDYSPAGYSQGTFFVMKPIDSNGPDQWTLVQDWNKNAVNSVLLGFSFDRSKVETQIANCSVVNEKFSSELQAGVQDPKVKVPELYAELTKAGLEDIRTEMQTQIDAWIASNK